MNNNIKIELKDTQYKDGVKAYLIRFYYYKYVSVESHNDWLVTKYDKTTFYKSQLDFSINEFNLVKKFAKNLINNEFGSK